MTLKGSGQFIVAGHDLSHLVRGVTYTDHVDDIPCVTLEFVFGRDAAPDVVGFIKKLADESVWVIRDTDNEIYPEYHETS